MKKSVAYKKTVYLIRFLDNPIRPLVLILLKMSGYVKTFKFKDKNNKLMSLHVNGEKLLEKYKAIWIKTEDLKNIELNVLPVYIYIYMYIHMYIHINQNKNKWQ